MKKVIPIRDERIEHLSGGHRQWWDVFEKRMVSSSTAYIAFGCPDWGEKNGERNSLCTFCALPNAVRVYRDAFYAGSAIPDSDHVDLFAETLRAEIDGGQAHTLFIFNAGSFLAMPALVQEKIIREVATRKFIKRVVIESRAPLITEAILAPIVEILRLANMHLTIRVGIESQDDHLRLKILKKGHSRAQLQKATETMRSLGVHSGGYALLNPAPGLDPDWALAEAIATIDWILGDDGLGMDEAYFGPTCVGVDSPLAGEWKRGNFFPADLWSVQKVLETSIARHGRRVHLLPFVDTPAFLSVPSNHVPAGIPESLDGAVGCDREFHSMFDRYRETMEPRDLYKIVCHCMKTDV